MRLTAAQCTVMRAALSNAYPTREMLRRMLRVRTETDLKVAGGETYGDVLFDLITWVASDGRRTERLEKALEKKPRNFDLRRFVEEFRTLVAKAPPGSLDLSL